MNELSGGDFNQTQYQLNAQNYMESNQDGKIGGDSPEIRAELLRSLLPIGASIFEIGSGEGLDAIELTKRGYEVVASDYVHAFVEALKANGLNAISFDAKKDMLPSQFNCVYANAVFVHFSSEEISSFLSRIKSSLINEKIIFLSIIKGEGSKREGRNRGFDRDFHYYQLKDIIQLAEENGFEVVKTNEPDEKWLQVILKLK